MITDMLTKYLSFWPTGDLWRDVRLSNSTKLLTIPSGHAQGTTEGPMNARLGQL